MAAIPDVFGGSLALMAFRNPMIWKYDTRLTCSFSRGCDSEIVPQSFSGPNLASYTKRKRGNSHQSMPPNPHSPNHHIDDASRSSLIRSAALSATA